MHRTAYRQYIVKVIAINFAVTSGNGHVHILMADGKFKIKINIDRQFATVPD